MLLIVIILVLGQLTRPFPDGYGKDESPFTASVYEIAVQFIVNASEVTGFYLYMDAYEMDESAEKPTLAVIHAHFAKKCQDNASRLSQLMSYVWRS
jgi:hypothetical protein